MIDYYQGDIIKIDEYKNKLFVVVSKNAFIRATGFLHVCPFLTDIPEGPIHIKVIGKSKHSGVVICEQIKLLDTSSRKLKKVDYLAYEDIMDISDVIQGIFEYD